MSNLIITYLLGLSTVNSLLLLWFFSPLKITLSEIFLRKTLMPLEFDDFVYSKSKILGKLNSCWICLSFWSSLVIGIVFTVFLNLPVFWPVITFFTYPSLCYLFYINIKK